MRNSRKKSAIPAGILASNDVETKDKFFVPPWGSTEVVSIEGGAKESKFNDESTKRKLLSNFDSATSVSAGIAAKKTKICIHLNCVGIQNSRRNR